MRVYLWNDSLAVGIPTVDDQHKEILVALRELQLGFYDKISEEEIEEKLIIINQYRNEHFKTEEELMEPYKDKLACYTAHMKAHKNFDESIEKFFVRFKEEGVEIVEELVNVLGQWLHVHINGLDKEMAKELKELGAPLFK